MKTNELIYSFRDYLNSSLPLVTRMLADTEEYDEALSDWMQSSWEMLVETALFYGSKKSLVIYGDGADVCKGSSRATFPELTATHRIVCRCELMKEDLVSQVEIEVSDFEFEQFVSWCDGKYSFDGFLNSILLSKDNQYFVVSTDNVVFDVAELLG